MILYIILRRLEAEKKKSFSEIIIKTTISFIDNSYDLPLFQILTLDVIVLILLLADLTISTLVSLFIIYKNTNIKAAYLLQVCTLVILL